MKTSIERLLQGSAAIALIVALGACGETAGSPTTGTESTSTSTTTTPAAPTSTAPVGDPDIQAEIDWFVSILNGGDLSEDDFELRFNAGFRTQVPFADLQPVLDELRPQGPFTVVERRGQEKQGEAVAESADGTRVRILAELDERSRFTALLIQPDDLRALDDPPESVEEAFDRLADIGTGRALAAEVVNGRCVPVATTESDDAAPLGSVAKLYVLATLGEAVLAGDVAWDEEVVIRDDLKSVPSGVLQDREEGETVTVHEAAELMISMSDNTATDHLIDLLGRETIESAMAEYGNTTPELSTPFLSTREFTALKVGPASGLSIQWVNGDEATRRAILTQLSDITPADLPVQEWVEPVDPDLLEWFASPEDLCRLAVRLSDLAGSVPEIGDILEVNPGVPAPQGTWERIWFKGGSEPGMAAAWFVTESEGRTFVTAGSVVDPEAVIDTEKAVLLLAAARDLLSP